MRLPKLLILLLLTTTVSLTAKGQREYSFSLLGGYTVPNSDEWSYIGGFSSGIDAAIGWQQDWGYEDTNGFFPLLRPKYQLGIRGNFTYFPNDIAGHRFGFCGFLKEPVFHFKNRMLLPCDTNIVTVLNPLCLEMDFGLAAYTNPFCRTPNPQNVFIGSYVNCLIQIGLSYSHMLRNQSRIVLAAKFAHSSNGYLQKPNKGLNYLQLSLGFSLPPISINGQKCLVSCFDTVDKKSTSFLPVSNWKDKPFDNPAFRGSDIFFSYAPGIVMPRYTGASKKYFYAHTARVGWIYRFNPARAVGVNIDLTYNYSHTAVISHWNEDYNLPFYIGLAAAYEATYHRLTLHTALAAYLTRSEHGTTPLYERVGLFYNLSKEYRRVRHFVGVSLKSHMAHVDFIEWHYGIKFRVKNNK
jgi:hypothetical protein